MEVKIVKSRSFWIGTYKLKVKVVGMEFQIDKIKQEIEEITLKYMKDMGKFYTEG